MDSLPAEHHFNEPWAYGELGLSTSDLPGIGGVIKFSAEDFMVEEIPAYPLSGEGEHLYLWIEKRDIGTEEVKAKLVELLEVSPDSIGVAGRKDKYALARQYISVPRTSESRLATLDIPGVKILEAGVHGNKLRTGHLRGNKFAITVRDIGPGAAEKCDCIRDKLLHGGLANFFGPQRFGKKGFNANKGLDLLKAGKTGGRMGRFYLSAAQSLLFNHYLYMRLREDLCADVIDGDVLFKAGGGIFRSEDRLLDARRLQKREVFGTGPVFGSKMFSAAGVAAERESRVLQEWGLTAEKCAALGKKLPGGRRRLLVYPEDLQFTVDGAKAVFQFSLPAGSFATVLLAEFMKT